MPQIQATQIKAARAILGWSQEYLANSTSLSITTIRNLEMGFISRGSTMNVVRKTIEEAGVEFIHPEGVRRRMEEITIYKGIDSTDNFFEDLTETIKKKQCDIAAVLPAQDTLIQAIGAVGRSNAKRLDKLNEITRTRCLLSEPDEMPVLLPNYHFRTIPKQYASAIPYFVYGGKHALVLIESPTTVKYVIFHSMAMSQSYSNQFEVLWEAASPLIVPTVQQKIRSAQN